jgi:cytochrome P450
MAPPTQDKTPNHRLSALRCPVALGDVDLFSPGAQEHWYEAYPILHAEAPVQKIPGEGLGPGSDGFVLSKYSDIARVVRDPERFKPLLSVALEADARAREAAPETPSTLNAMLASMQTLRPDMELWRAHRQELTDPWVGPGSTRHTQLITDTADALIDDWIDAGRVEFVSSFARPLPQRVMAAVLGFPEDDLPRLEAWGNAMVRPFVHGRGHRNLLSREELAEQTAELSSFGEYVLEHVRARREAPGDDMISFLTGVTYQALGRKLSDTEIHGIVYAMMLGGLETTQYALEQGAQLLCDDPQLLATLRADRTRVRAFVEETLRLRAPTQGLSTRMTTRDEEFQGVAVPAGSLLHLRWAAGNVDPDEYDCPYALQLDRKGLGRHLAFSQGHRSCPGAHISRLEQRIAWNRLLDRIESLEYAPGNTFVHQPGIMLGTLELHLRFSKAGDAKASKANAPQ